MNTDAARKLLEACAGECPVDATATCTQKPDCPDYLAAGAWQEARDEIEALAPNLLRVADGLAEALEGIVRRYEDTDCPSGYEAEMMRDDAWEALTEWEKLWKEK